MKEKFYSERKIRIKTVSSFGFFIIAIAAAFFGWKWLRSEPIVDGIQSPIRKGLSINESIFSPGSGAIRLAKTYPKSEAVKSVRVNGDVGMGNDFDASTWKLAVVKNDNDTFYVTMDDIKKLPKTEVVFDFKCIEGWDQKTWWGGVKFSDFIKAYHLDNETKKSFVGMQTPAGEYYIGIDMPSALQEQTLLCYEMNGQPLPMNQGYPLRLIIPVKYGIKHIKRIGTIYFSNSRPPDYWAERGYDYYAGH